MPTLDVYNTHMELYPYKQFDLLWLEKQYTATDKFTNNEYACGYIIHDGKMYLPKGTSISKIEYTAGCKANEYNSSDPADPMSRRHSAYYEPRNAVQSDSIKFLQGEGHQFGLTLSTGVGKCEPITRKIPCPDSPCGYKLMGEIRPGDRVFGSDGSIINVLATFPQGIKDIYQITFSDGRIAECGAEHLWPIFTLWNGKYNIMKTEDLIKDYKVYRNFKAKRSPNRDPHDYKYLVPLLSEPVEYPHKDVSVHPYVLGAFIGNGCCTLDKLTISSGDDFVPLKVAKLLDCQIQKCKGNFSYEFFRMNNGKKEYLKTADALPDLYKKYSHQKYIPDIYLYNDYETRLELLRGLMDTDGSISKNFPRYNVSYSSSSKLLLEQIRWIIMSFGYISKLQKPDPRIEHYRAGYHAEVSIRIPHSFKRCIFTHPAKLAKAIEAGKRSFDLKQKYEYLKIKDIRLVRQEAAQCIMVDAPDHLYLTEDFIVTHNTFCVAYASTEANVRTLIITPNSSLKSQWIKTYRTMFDYKAKELMDIAGSPIMEAIMEGELPEADVYFVNHQTLRSFLSTWGPYKLREFFTKLKIGIKVYDESHMEFANILLIDFLSNTDKTWYLTATFDRSDKTESLCFQKAFSSVETFGKAESFTINRKHVIYHIVNINSKIDPKNKARLMGYPGFSANKYGHYCVNEDSNETAYKTILAILNKTTEIEGKTLIFLPLIENVDEVVKRLKRDYPQKSVAAYHSKIDKEEKDSAEKKDIIVSTIKSCGTGRDIKGLRVVICFEPVASKVVTEQCIGRLRPYADDKDTFYFDCVDTSIPALNWWFKARFKCVPALVKQVVEINDILG